MKDKVIAFLPCRKGSERVKEKNTRSFAGIEGGLTKIKLDQLIACPEIDEITVSTDDPVVMSLAEIAAQKTDKPVHIKERPSHLAESSTSTDTLIRHIPEIISQGIVLWTHVTAPFVDNETYSHAIRRFWETTKQNEHDSLMAVNEVQTFLWNANGPVNYDRNKEKWPRTQTLPKWYEVNSAFFIATIESYIMESDRIGINPYMYELGFPESVDIDTEEQFYFAEWTWRFRNEK